MEEMSKEYKIYKMQNEYSRLFNEIRSKISGHGLFEPKEIPLRKLSNSSLSLRKKIDILKKLDMDLMDDIYVQKRQKQEINELKEILETIIKDKHLGQEVMDKLNHITIRDSDSAYDNKMILWKLNDLWLEVDEMIRSKTNSLELNSFQSDHIKPKMNGEDRNNSKNGMGTEKEGSNTKNSVSTNKHSGTGDSRKNVRSEHDIYKTIEADALEIHKIYKYIESIIKWIESLGFNNDDSLKTEYDDLKSDYQFCIKEWEQTAKVYPPREVLERLLDFKIGLTKIAIRLSPELTEKAKKLPLFLRSTICSHVIGEQLEDNNKSYDDILMAAEADIIKTNEVRRDIENIIESIKDAKLDNNSTLKIEYDNINNNYQNWMKKYEENHCVYSLKQILENLLNLKTDFIRTGVELSPELKEKTKGLSPFVIGVANRGIIKERLEGNNKSYIEIFKAIESDIMKLEEVHKDNKNLIRRINDGFKKENDANQNALANSTSPEIPLRSSNDLKTKPSSFEGSTKAYFKNVAKNLSDMPLYRSPLVRAISYISMGILLIGLVYTLVIKLGPAKLS